jgi:hypothetical protein
MVELADIVRQHGPSYLEQRGCALTAEQQRALVDIATCHTHQMGGICRFCPECGKSQFIGYSCRNRACPRCHGKHSAQWLQARMGEMLPVPYYHIVFTLPQQLHGLIRAHPKRLLALFVRCCAQTILQLADDPKWIGGQPALLTVLHTARRDLAYHPHVHCVVSAGGYDATRSQWVAPARPDYLFPSAVLGCMARQKLLDGIRTCLPQCNIPKGMYKCNWVVHCEGSHSDASHVVRYLARYVFRLPLCNGRIEQADEHTVVYRYRPNSSKADKRLHIDPHSFLDRYLQHVLPKGFHAVRYWGLWTARRRPMLHHLQLSLARRHAMAMWHIVSQNPPVPDSTDRPTLCLQCGVPLEYAQVPPARTRHGRRLLPTISHVHGDNLPGASP